MKKFFTLFAVAMMAVCANAQVAWTVEKGKTYEVGTKLYEDSYATITTSLAAGSAVTFADEDSNPTPKTINGVTFEAYVACRVENLPSAANNWEGEAGAGIAVKISAKKNTDIEIYARYGATKTITLVDATSMSSESTINVSKEEDNDNILVVEKAQLQAGHNYVLCMRGGTMGLCGINVKEGTYVAPTSNIYANASAAVVDGFSTMTYGDGAKVALVGNSTKSYSNGSGITIGGKKYTTTKVSNGAQNMFFAPEGKFITKATIWSYVNKDAATDRDCYWKEVNGQAYSLDGADGSVITTIMGSYKNLETPDNYTYELGGISGFTFTNTGEQACFVIEVEYGAEGPANAIKNVNAAVQTQVVKVVENGQLVIKSAKGTFNVAGAQIK